MTQEEKSYVAPLSKKQVDVITDSIIDKSNKDGYLDHTIRAVEDYVIDKRSNDNFYRISKNVNRNPRFKAGQGWVFIYEYGASIKYAPSSQGTDKRFAIAHELGHIMLHYKHDAENGNSIFINDPVKETQASYFAKKILNNRKDLISRSNGLLPLYDNDISKYCSSYDINLLN
ncbi:MAG: ImmA/IrrE family metallo-endopeptidase [Lachnospiraceae bacterium]|nr:ImmA/IrrE family metallo-endopeptidase [Lachnospiraceae bacterium]